MPDILTRAIRDRNLTLATHTITELQQRLSNEAITALILEAVERLAWDEGDRSAATWLLHQAHRYRR